MDSGYTASITRVMGARDRAALIAGCRDAGRSSAARGGDHLLHSLGPGACRHSWGFIQGSDVIRWKRGLVLLILALGCLFVGSGRRVAVV